jgi:hypothetical protein
MQLRAEKKGYSAGISLPTIDCDWLAARDSDRSWMHIKVSSDWLPSYIKATWPVLEIFKMDGYFPDRPHTGYVVWNIITNVIVVVYTV